jgi:hypothetical protein
MHKQDEVFEDYDGRTSRVVDTSLAIQRPEGNKPRIVYLAKACASVSPKYKLYFGNVVDNAELNVMTYYEGAGVSLEGRMQITDAQRSTAKAMLEALQ